jgi:hypothetical protein
MGDESVLRKLLILPARVSEPRIDNLPVSPSSDPYYPSPEFNNNKFQLNTMCLQQFFLHHQADPDDDGEYFIYFRTSTSLPVNAAIAKLIGVSVGGLGKRAFWRGDAFVVKVDRQFRFKPSGEKSLCTCTILDTNLSAAQWLAAPLKHVYRNSYIEPRGPTDGREYIQYFTLFLAHSITSSMIASITPFCFDGGNCSSYIWNPFTPVRRMTLVFPADGPEPQLERRMFNVEHAMLFTIGVDLAKSYGKQEKHARFEWFSLACLSDELTHGEYCVYFTLEPSLPVNRCLTRAFHIGSDELKFRGDVVVVKQERWSEVGPFAVYGVHHAAYFDVRPPIVPVLLEKIKGLHESLAVAISEGEVKGTCKLYISAVLFLVQFLDQVSTSRNTTKRWQWHVSPYQRFLVLNHIFLSQKWNDT